MNADKLDGGIIQSGVRVNAARGTGSLARQWLMKLGAPESVATGLGEVVRTGLGRAGIPDEDLTPVEIAERCGLLPQEKKTKRRPRA